MGNKTSRGVNSSSFPIISTKKNFKPLFPQNFPRSKAGLIIASEGLMRLFINFMILHRKKLPSSKLILQKRK